MKKVAVIISHEYKTRVTSKWFIISTLLGPLAMVLLIAIPVAAAMLMGDGAEAKVAIKDDSGLNLGAQIVQSDTSKYQLDAGMTESELIAAVKDESLQAYVVIPPEILVDGKVKMFSRGGSGFTFEETIQNAIEPYVVKARLRANGTDVAVIDLIEKGVSIESLKITDSGLEKDGSAVSAAIGYAAGFAIYILIFLYGTMVMRGVIEEKANRIVEVLASSAKPFEIMMGKVVGIGLVGLTQVVAWAVLGTVVTVVMGMFMGGGGAESMLTKSQEMSAVGGMQMNQNQMILGNIAIPNISPFAILLFIFYFLAGFFIYATLFAAVGSAVDQEADANQLMLPITLPIIVTIMFIGNVVSAPNSTLSVVLSLIPPFTPILMTVRVAATDVPLWQLASSVVLVISTFFGAIWVASRVYRIGILSYGKKPSFKDIARWVTTSQ